MARFLRRTVLQGIASAGLAAALGSAPLQAGEAHIVVATGSGRVAGRRRDDISVFKGIPYGASTAGPGRFRPPRKPVPWPGTLDARADPPEAPQRDPRRPGRTEAPNPLAGVEPDWPLLGESEDCLKLDVWTPSAEDGARRPVMVWFHGGGFAVGSAAGLWQDGGHLARRGNVVVVSPNHRLNVFGHAYLDPLDAAFAGAGNAGMLDLVLALEWVRDNIGRFGGDPADVTIFGQSGGGQKVSMLLAMPAAAGLFHKAIIESGPAPKALEPGYATDMAKRLVAKLGLADGALGALETLPVERIMRAYYDVFDETGGYGVLGVLQGFAPVVDGAILPRHPFVDGAPSISADVPLLIGTTRTEMTLNTLLADPTADGMDEAGLRSRLDRLFGKDAARVLDAYRAAHPSWSPWQLYAVITADWPTRIYSIRIAEQKASTRKAPVFMYRTDWRTPVASGRLMSPHAIDIGFVLDDFDDTASFDGGGPEVAALSHRMSAAWLAFARNGDPNTPSLPPWPVYDPAAARATMLFDTECRVEGDPDGADRRAMDSIMAGR